MQTLKHMHAFQGSLAVVLSHPYSAVVAWLQHPDTVTDATLPKSLKTWLLSDVVQGEMRTGCLTTVPAPNKVGLPPFKLVALLGNWLASGLCMQWPANSMRAPVLPLFLKEHAAFMVAHQTQMDFSGLDPADTRDIAIHTVEPLCRILGIALQEGTAVQAQVVNSCLKFGLVTTNEPASVFSGALMEQKIIDFEDALLAKSRSSRKQGFDVLVMKPFHLVDVAMVLRVIGQQLQQCALLQPKQFKAVADQYIRNLPPEDAIMAAADTASWAAVLIAEVICLTEVSTIVADDANDYNYSLWILACLLTNIYAAWLYNSRPAEQALLQQYVDLNPLLLQVELDSSIRGAVITLAESRWLCTTEEQFAAEFYDRGDTYLDEILPHLNIERAPRYETELPSPRNAENLKTALNRVVATAADSYMRDMPCSRTEYLVTAMHQHLLKLGFASKPPIEPSLDRLELAGL